MQTLADDSVSLVTACLVGNIGRRQQLAAMPSVLCCIVRVYLVAGNSLWLVCLAGNIGLLHAVFG